MCQHEQRDEEPLIKQRNITSPKVTLLMKLSWEDDSENRKTSLRQKILEVSTWLLLNLGSSYSYKLKLTRQQHTDLMNSSPSIMLVDGFKYGSVYGMTIEDGYSTDTSSLVVIVERIKENEYR